MRNDYQLYQEEKVIFQFQLKWFKMIQIDSIINLQMNQLSSSSYNSPRTKNGNKQSKN